MRAGARGRKYPARRKGPAGRRAPAARTGDAVFLAAVAAFALAFAGLTVSHARRSGEAAPSAGRAPFAAAGKPRDVDMQKVRALIRQGRLSTKEADFYRKIGTPPDGRPEGE